MGRGGTWGVGVGNPPYQGIGKLTNGSALVRAYPDGKTDMFAMFYLRALELLRPDGLVGMVTLSNWMSLGSFEALRTRLLNSEIRLIADFGKAAFSTGGTLISTSATIIANRLQLGQSIALRPHSPDEIVRDDGQPDRTHAALLLQRGRYEFDPRGFEVIEGQPIVYWWGKEFLQRYAEAPKLGEVSPARQGLATADDTRFIRVPWELVAGHVGWDCFVKGAEGKAWIEPVSYLIDGRMNRLALAVFERAVFRNPRFQGRKGVAYAAIGSSFRARRYRTSSWFGHMGPSIFPVAADDALIVCSLNTQRASFVLTSLNPGLHFEVGDVNRLPLFPVPNADEIFASIERAFSEHESHREPSVEFRRPGPSPWTYAQSWAQRAVDRAPGEPLPEFSAEYDAPTPESHVSFALGIALGRFGVAGEGVVGQTSPPNPLSQD